MSGRVSFLIALVGGALAATGHAPFGLWPVSLAGLILLSACVARSSTAEGDGDSSVAWRTAKLGWAGGLGYFALSLSWIVEPFLVDVARHGWMAPFALVLLAGGLALFWGAAGWISRGNLLIWAMALSCFEMVRGHIFTGFPWALPGYIWIETPVAMWASVVGPYGLTGLTLLFTSLIVIVGMGARHVRFVSAVGCLGLVGVGVLGSTLESLTPAEQATLGTVRLVQPNAPQDEKWDPERAPVFVARQIEFTAAPKDGVDLVVWPETALPYRLHRATPVLSQIAGAAEGTPVVTGINRTVAGRHHNALIVLDNTGQPQEVYDKVHLVPFGEYIPFGQLAQWVGLRSFAARDGYGFSPGREVRLIETALGKALPLICYEAIFPGHGRGLERPDVLLQITNDAWFGTFSGPFQHLDQARFRAIEQGLPLVRVANTGVSAVIDANGRIVDALELDVAGYLDVAVPKGRAATIYARTGDAFAAVVFLVALSALMLASRRNGIANGRIRQ